MDDLLREFLTETFESLDTVDNQLVRFEQEPNNAKILDNIFRLVHTIKGTCGFLGLPRLEALAHAAETLMGKFRDGMPVTGEAVTLILTTIDRIKDILGGLEATEAEPEGEDGVIIGLKNKKATGKMNEAHIDSNGFFVHYDPQLKMAKNKKGEPIYARDKNGNTIPQNKTVNIQTQGHKMIPISNDDGEKV